MLSAVVITQNEEQNIERCLRSLDFCDEIVVVDALSEDSTVEIARRLGARVVPRRWAGFALQKQAAVDEAMGEWVLMVDADEEVTAPLSEEIRGVIQQESECNGFRIQRRNQFMGEWMRHGPWTRDYQIRLFRRSKGVVARRPVHEGVHASGNIGTLKNPLNHYTHQTLSSSVRRLNRYTTLEAADRLGRRKIRLFDAVLPPCGVFFKYFFLKGAWREGTRGFLLSALTAMYKSVLYLKIYFLQAPSPLDGSPREPA